MSGTEGGEDGGSWADRVHFGPVGQPLEFTPEELAAADFDPDDEELAETDPGVVAMLGFDPAKVSYDDAELPAKEPPDA